MTSLSKEAQTSDTAPQSKGGRVKRALRRVLPDVISQPLSEASVLTEQQRKVRRAGKVVGRTLLRAATIADPSIKEEMKSGTHDSLTGFLNKAAFMEVVKNKMENGDPVGILFLDLDNFKKVNDKISHVQGDDVLKRTGRFLFRSVRSEDELAHYSSTDDPEYEFTRFGGDEFMVLVDLRDRNGNVNYGALEAIQARIADGTPEFIQKQPHGSELQEVGFNISIGGAVPMPWEDAETVVERASLDMKLDKAAHKLAA